MVDIEDFRVEPSDIADLVIGSPKSVTDERGTVREFFRSSAFVDVGRELGPWQQVNLTFTRAGGIRGMHAENMTKLIGLASGEAFGAYVDLRGDSDTFGTVVTVALRPGVQVLVPAGVGNGFQAVTDCEYLYCFDQEWAPGMAGVAVTPLDPELGIDWPVAVEEADRSQVSAKDLAAPTLDALRKDLQA